MVRLIFARFRQLSSARQVFLSMLAEQVHFPRPVGKRLRALFNGIGLEEDILEWRNQPASPGVRCDRSEQHGAAPFSADTRNNKLLRVSSLWRGFYGRVGSA